jgi:hypothetical protein
MKTFQFSKIGIAILCLVAARIIWVAYERWPSAAKDGLLTEPSANVNQNVTTSLSSRSGSPPIAKVSAPPAPASAVTNSYTTYRPQHARPVRQYNGPIGSDNLISGRTPGWWLYASSEAEAQWLDYYGYPTPAEEAMLASSSDGELAVLVERGDLNAKAHQTARMVMKAFIDSDVKQMERAVFRADKLLVEGGPYQAFAVHKAYGDILRAYRALPDSERTTERKNALNRFNTMSDYGYEIGRMYSDLAVLQLSNTAVHGERASLGLPEIKPGTSEALAAALGGRTATRARLGLVTVLLPRPEPPGLPNNSPGAVILERY